MSNIDIDSLLLLCIIVRVTVTQSSDTQHCDIFKGWRVFTARRYASAVLLCYGLCSFVCLSVRQSVLCRNDWTNRAGFGMKACFHISHDVLQGNLSHEEIWIFHKIRVGPTSTWNFVPNSGLRKFRHGKSIALSTKLVVVVDSRACWRHLYDRQRGVAVYHKSVNSNSLTPLLRFLVDLLYKAAYNLFLQLTRFWSTARCADCLP